MIITQTSPFGIEVDKWHITERHWEAETKSNNILIIEAENLGEVLLIKDLEELIRIKGLDFLKEAVKKEKENL